MKTIKVVCAMFALFMAPVAQQTVASETTPAIHPNTAFEYWQDPCGYPAIVPTIYGGQVSRMLEAEALLVPPSQIERRTDDPNYYRFTSTRPNVNWANTSVPMGGDAPFLGETQMAPNGRSGFLIAPNIIATAAHDNNFNPYAFVVVFDVRSKPVPNVTPLSCAPPDPEHIPASNVYFPRPANALIANTILYYFNIYGAWTGVDYAAFYLDRAATDRRYLRIRKTGDISPEDHFAIASHPNRLRTKFLYGFDYRGEETNTSFPNFSFPTFNDFYLWDGMSGAAVYNVDRNYVETSVGAPTGAGCTAALPPNSIFNPESYYDIIDLCDDTPNPSEELVAFHEFNEGPISALANLVPTPYLRVSPLNDVTYILPINGAPSPSQTAYTATASATETANTTISAYVETVPTGQPQLLQLGSYNTSLAPGVSTTITATATVPTGTACGVYDRYVDIGDLTHFFNDRMRHRFEIGMTDFDISPVEDQEFYGVTAPSEPAQISFTLANSRPTATTVQVSTNQTWATVGGISGSQSPATVALAAAGQAGSTKTVKLSLTSAAFALSDGDHPIAVTFADQGACALTGPQQRTVVFHKGTLLLKQELGLYVPAPTPPGTPTTATLNVKESFCVSDASVRLDTGNVGSVLGEQLSDWAPYLQLALDFSGSNSSLSWLLWNNNALPAGWPVPSYYDDVLFADIQPLVLDNHANIPPTGASLMDVNNRDPKGTWTFRVYDTGPQGRNDGLLVRWQLHLQGHAGTCPN